MRGVAWIIVIGIAAGWRAGPAAANRYGDLRAAAVKRCEAVDPSEYQSGLAFNPDGYRSYYARSACFQDAAVQYRDEFLCRQVKERWTILWSSWGYSGKHCRKLVAEGAAADLRNLEAVKSGYRKGPVTLRDFRVERNGNGRDFDIVPTLDPGYEHGYALRFELVAAGAAGENVPVAASGFYLRGNENIRLYVRQADIRKRFPGFALDRPYQVRATLTLDAGNGGPSGMWSDAFIERVFPAAARTQVMAKPAAFRP